MDPVSTVSAAAAVAGPAMQAGAVVVNHYSKGTGPHSTDQAVDNIMEATNVYRQYRHIIPPSESAKLAKQALQLALSSSIILPPSSYYLSQGDWRRTLSEAAAQRGWKNEVNVLPLNPR